jgi:Bacteriophage HK97-gp10, putative tail-component
MSLDIVIDTSALERIGRQMAGIGARLKAELLTAMRESQTDLLDEIWTRVPVKSGTLHRSWTAREPMPGAGVGWKGVVASGLKSYAAFQEFGFHGAENVRAHSRLGHPVRAFTRSVNYAGRPYVRPSIPVAIPKIAGRHKDAVDRAMKGPG